MTKTFNSTGIGITNTNSDVYVAPSKSMTLLIQVVNTSSSAVTVEVWMTNANNINYVCLFPSQSIPPYNGISDTAKHIIPQGYKIFAVASTSGAAYIEISTIEGL